MSPHYISTSQAKEIQDFAMFSLFTKFFGPRLGVCDCCNHNIDIELLLEDNEVAERKTMKKKIRCLLASLRWKGIKEKGKKNTVSARRAFRKCFNTIHKRIQCTGNKKRTFGVRRKTTPQISDTATVTDDRADPLKSAVRQLLTTMFTDIVESDITIAKQTHSTTQCFLVHPLVDLDPNGSFLSRSAQPPSSAFNLDLNFALTFVSRYLQSALTTIKTVYPEGGHDLHMPFCVLETTQGGANARARTLQRRNPDEKVGIATLDFAALQREKLVASATHTFDFLRVSRRDFYCGRKLLAWAEGGQDEHSANALRNAVLTVIEWKDTDVATDVESVGEELQVAAETPLPEDQGEEQWARWMNAVEKKDSGAGGRAALKDSKGVKVTTSEIALTEEEYPRFLSL